MYWSFVPFLKGQRDNRATERNIMTSRIRTMTIWAFVVAVTFVFYRPSMAQDEQPAKQTLELASPFVDNAVLQRRMEVPVWGWAEPGSKVTVVFADQTKTATADEMGKWMVKVEPLNASHAERELCSCINATV